MHTTIFSLIGLDQCNISDEAKQEIYKKLVNQMSPIMHQIFVEHFGYGRSYTDLADKILLPVSQIEAWALQSIQLMQRHISRL